MADWSGALLTVGAIAAEGLLLGALGELLLRLVHEGGAGDLSE
jgi:hypothetical protein